MGMSDLAEFESMLADRLSHSDGAGAAALLPDDPKERLGRGFNRHMSGVDAAAIDVAYLLPLVTLAAKGEDGEVADVETLFKLTHGIQKRVARKLTAQARRAARPRVRPRRRPGDAGPPPEGRDLFAPDGGLAEVQPGREPDPSFALRRRELFPILLAGAREMGRLPERVFREVRRFGERRGTQFGAFTEVARAAVLDAEGRVIAIRPHDPTGARGDAPAVAVVRQVRRYYQAAADYLIGRGDWQGYTAL